MALAIELPPHQEQTRVNLERWDRILADPELATLNHRIETDRHGKIIMSPPPGSQHSNRQSKILLKLSELLTNGYPRVEVPISTSDGIRAADVAWTSDRRFEEIYDPRAYLAAPDLCVEVVSPANSEREMAEKKALYFDAGALEVWLCQPDGRLEIFTADRPDERATDSAICPGFPTQIDSP